MTRGRGANQAVNRTFRDGCRRLGVLVQVHVQRCRRRLAVAGDEEVRPVEPRACARTRRSRQRSGKIVRFTHAFERLARRKAFQVGHVGAEENARRATGSLVSQVRRRRRERLCVHAVRVIRKRYQPRRDDRHKGERLHWQNLGRWDGRRQFCFVSAPWSHNWQQEGGRERMRVKERCFGENSPDERLG